MKGSLRGQKNPPVSELRTGLENVLLHLLRASREGNGNLHLNAIRGMIPWCFAYDKVNYTRYLSAYYVQMTNVPEVYLCVYEAFNSGQFSVQIYSNNQFGRVPVHQTVETTVHEQRHPDSWR